MKKIISAIIVIGLLVAGGYLLITQQAGGSFEEDWGITGEISGKWRVKPYVITEDGERISLNQPQSFWVKHEDVYVDQVQYVIEGQAIRDVGPGSYDSILVDLTELIMGMKAEKQSGTGNYMSFTKEGFGTKTITFPDDTSATSDWVEIATYTVPMDCEYQTINDGNKAPYTLGTNSLTDMTELWEAGIWMFDYYCTGSITIQGLNSDVGDGDVLDASIPGTVYTTVEIGDFQVTIDWSTQVTYS